MEDLYTIGNTFQKVRRSFAFGMALHAVKLPELKRDLTDHCENAKIYQAQEIKIGKKKTSIVKEAKELEDGMNEDDQLKNGKKSSTRTASRQKRKK